MKRETKKQHLQILKHLSASFDRILPHVAVSKWELVKKAPSSASVKWKNNERKEIEVLVLIPGEKNQTKFAYRTTVSRISVPKPSVGEKNKTLNESERSICDEILGCFNNLVDPPLEESRDWLLEIAKANFDEQVVIQFLTKRLGIELNLRNIFRELHKLSEQTYENKSLNFGLIISPKKSLDDGPTFPEDFFKYKKYRALSDGFKTAYLISSDGHIQDFLDLEKNSEDVSTKGGGRYYPEWVSPLAKSSTDDHVGFALTRQGDILVFYNGSLQFTYRYGRWQFWNHNYLLNVLHGLARAQNVRNVGLVTSSIYRAALSISFRRSGGLFVILKNRNNLREIIREGDAMPDRTRGEEDIQFDKALPGEKIQGLSTLITSELASLDGAVVVRNDGGLLAYGAVLQPKRKGKTLGSEGSRTKAAIGSSKYGLAVKVSSDGDIAVYFEGKKFITI